MLFKDLNHGNEVQQRPVQEQDHATCHRMTHSAGWALKGCNHEADHGPALPLPPSPLSVMTQSDVTALMFKRMWYQGLGFCLYLPVVETFRGGLVAAWGGNHG